jgi:hypothetical protein
MSTGASGGEVATGRTCRLNLDVEQQVGLPIMHLAT